MEKEAKGSLHCSQPRIAASPHTARQTTTILLFAPCPLVAGNCTRQLQLLQRTLTRSILLRMEKLMKLVSMMTWRWNRKGHATTVRAVQQREAESTKTQQQQPRQRGGGGSRSSSISATVALTA